MSYEPPPLLNHRSPDVHGERKTRARKNINCRRFKTKFVGSPHLNFCLIYLLWRRAEYKPWGCSLDPICFSLRVSSGLKLIKQGGITGLKPQGVSALPSQYWGYWYILLCLAVFHKFSGSKSGPWVYRASNLLPNWKFLFLKFTFQ